MERIYHIHRNGEAFGPYSETQVAQMLAEGSLIPDDLAWSEGMPQWQPLASYPAFVPLIDPGAPVPAIPTDPAASFPQGSATARYLARQSGRARPRRSIGVKIGILATVGLVLAAGLAWCCASWWTGRRAESGLRAWITSMTDTAPPGLEARLVAYRRGIFSSECTTRIAMVSDEDPIEFDLRHDIVHGPFLLLHGPASSGVCRIITTLDQQSMNADARTVIRNAFSDQEPLRIASDVDFSGNLALAASVAPLHFEVDDVRIAFNGLTGTMQLDEGGERLIGEYTFGPVEMTEPSSARRIHVAKGAARVEVDEMTSGVVLHGGTRLDIPSVSFGDSESGIEFAELQATTSTRTRAGIQSQETEFKIGRISVTGNSPAPVQLEGALTLTGKLEGLDLDALTRLQNAYATLSEIATDDTGGVSNVQNDASSEESILGPNGATPDIMPQLGAIYAAGVDLVQPGLGADVTLRIGSPSGDVRLSASIAFGGDVPLMDTRTLGEAVNAIQARAQVDLPKDFLTDPELLAMLDDPLEDGYIVDRGDAYTVILSMNDGTIRLNAAELPIPEELREALAVEVDWSDPLEAIAVLAVGTESIEIGEPGYQVDESMVPEFELPDLPE